MTSGHLFSAIEVVVQALASLGIRFCLIGGAAMPAWRHLRMTLDADFLLAVSSPDRDALAAKAIEALRDRGFAHMSKADRRVVDDTLILFFYYPVRDLGFSVRVDLLLAEGELYESVLQRTVPRKIDGQEAPIASCEDLILLKMKAGRPIDMADARALHELHAQALDRAYLEQWVARLRLGAVWAEVTRP